MHGHTPRLARILVVLAAVLLPGCATLREVAALRYVDFSLAGTSGGTLAGIPIQSTHDFDDLSLLDLARIGRALSSRELPLEVVLDVRAANPSDSAPARLLALDWTLFLDGRETVSGAIDQEYSLSPGEPVSVPVPVRLDLLDFFDEQLEETVALGLAVAGAGEPQRIRLEATPSIQTPLGAVRYPEPVRIEYEVGSDPLL